MNWPARYSVMNEICTLPRKEEANVQTQEEPSLNHATEATPPPVEPSKPSPSQKDRQSPDSNLLTDSEFASLKKAELSARESTKKLYPHIKFV